jgi:CRISPR-associated endonuclease/helicase Cas3
MIKFDPKKSGWAKTCEDGSPGLSVFDHCCHVGWVALELVNQSRNIPDGKLIPIAAAIIAAIHDVGKWSPGFLQKCVLWLEKEHLSLTAVREAWEAQQDTRHEKHSQDSIQLLLQSRGIKQSVAEAWAMVAGAHHGKMHVPENYGNDDVTLFIDKWHSQRHQLIEALEEKFASKVPSFEIKKRDAIVPWLMGLTSVADWIGSDETYFPVHKGLDTEQGKKSASLAVESIGLGKPHIRNDLSFGDIFGFNANDLQEKALTVIKEPGIYVIEAPMGLGKTEAALACTYELLKTGKASGLYFALPTQLTSNRIHLRVKDFANKISVNCENTRLAHANAWLEENYYQPRTVKTLLKMPDGDATASRDWFASSKRALLANFGVGTIDQALMSIVAVKHFFVRRFALAGKVIVIDEVHSYDYFTGTLVKCLCNELLKLGCTVIILSATLLPKVRNNLIGVDENIIEIDDYPLITGKTCSGEIVQPHVTTAPARPSVRRLFKDQNNLLKDAVKAAQQGARVLWVCNTVNAAQQIFDQLPKNDNSFELGLLHSRYPHFCRQQQEGYWMERLGKEGRQQGGCILVSTQIVEQSVDIDADILISDLAPMDMLLQRIGRLWRHLEARSAENRPVDQPEIWILEEAKPLEDLIKENSEDIKKTLGVKEKVYQAYALLKTYQTLHDYEIINLSDENGKSQIRDLLKTTYENSKEDSDSWQQLHNEVQGTEYAEKKLAEGNTRLFSRMALDDEEGKQTRLIEIETIPLVIATSITSEQITLLNGSSISLPVKEFNIQDARAIHENIVRVHAWPFEQVKKESGLSFYLKGKHCLALLADDNQLIIESLKPNMSLSWCATKGVIQKYDKGGRDESCD